MVTLDLSIPNFITVGLMGALFFFGVGLLWKLVAGMRAPVVSGSTNGAAQ